MGAEWFARNWEGKMREMQWLCSKEPFALQSAGAAVSFDIFNKYSNSLQDPCTMFQVFTSCTNWTSPCDFQLSFSPRVGSSRGSLR